MRTEGDVGGNHRRILLVSTFASRLLAALVIILASYLPLFDSSPQVLLPESTWTSSSLRWDAFHFAHVAQDGYTYEHDWAFFPGTPFVMRYVGALLGKDDWTAVLRGGVFAALACDTTLVLYDLSLHHLHSESLAFLAALLSLIPSSPATMRYAPYTEPFFAYLSYLGRVCI
jgi:GPI mannosyltransferase 2